MQRLRNIFDDLWAALMMFTRLPWWRIYQPSSEHFQNAATYWPLVGLLTGGVLAGVFALSIHFFSISIAVLITIASRLLLTGALHEDGLADFCDGMGGGTTRERTLEIMKDSHIGTYGVIGLILYFGTYYFGIRELTMGFLNLSMTTATACKNPVLLTCLALLCTDVFSKCVASNIIHILPYARKEEEAKNHTIYKRSFASSIIMLILFIPMVILWANLWPSYHVSFVIIVPTAVSFLIFRWLKKRIGGYTGDCCGATFLICEISTLLAWLWILNS